MLAMLLPYLEEPPTSAMGEDQVRMAWGVRIIEREHPISIRDRRNGDF